MDNGDEILRLRNRVHKQTSELYTLKFRLDAAEKKLDKYAEITEHLQDEQEIQQRIKLAVKENNNLYLTGAQKAGAILLGSIAVADFILHFI